MTTKHDVDKTGADLIRRATGGALVLAALLAAPLAHAGTVAPLSTLSAMPRPSSLKLPEMTTSIAGLTVKTRKDGFAKAAWHDLEAATGRGFCLVQTTAGRRWMSSYGTTAQGAVEELQLDRLVEKDGTATLERTTLKFDPTLPSITPVGRSHVDLHEVARTGAGIVVWAYREGTNVVVLTRNADSGQEPANLNDDVGAPFVSMEGCPYAGVRLDARKPEAGSFAQLSGTLPATGTGKDRVTPRFSVDASLSRVARDPEPMLSVRVRIPD